MFWPITVGILLNVFGFIYSIITIKHSLNKDEWDSFYTWYGTSSIIKYLLLLIGILVAILLFELDKTYFLLSFFISYIIFLIFEIIYLNKTKSFSKFATENKNKAK